MDSFMPVQAGQPTAARLSQPAVLAQQITYTQLTLVGPSSTCASLKMFFFLSMIFSRPPSIQVPTSPAHTS
jgi:hypothetical protein